MKKSTHGFLALSAWILALGGFFMPAVAATTGGETTGQYIDDTSITTKVKAALLADAQLKALQVGVETTQGMVRLTGSVDNKSQEAEAISVAKKINGVKAVEDRMTIRSTGAQ